LLLTGWKIGTTESRITQVADNWNQNILYLLNYPCRHWIKGVGFRWHTRKDFGDFRTADRRDVAKAIGRSDLNIGGYSSRRGSPDVLDLTPEKCNKVVHRVS